MRPRSRMLAKRLLLLPTITEGYEELVRGQANSLSSEDYLLSICQLARPTFPPHPSPSDIIIPRQQDSLNQRLPRLTAHDRCQSTFDPDYREEAHRNDICDDISADEVVVSGCHGTIDPLEYLYGHHDNAAPFTCQSRSLRQRLDEARSGRRQEEGSEGQTRPHAYSFPHSCPPSISHFRKNSCPGHSLLLTPQSAPIAPSLPYTATQPASSPGNSPQPRPPSPEGQGGGERQGPRLKHSLMSQWISGCRSAWREARVRTCMLPTITEM